MQGPVGLSEAQVCKIYFESRSESRCEIGVSQNESPGLVARAFLFLEVPGILGRSSETLLRKGKEQSRHACLNHGISDHFERAEAGSRQLMT